MQRSRVLAGSGLRNNKREAQVPVQSSGATEPRGYREENNSRRAATKVLQPMLFLMEKKMFEVRRKIASFEPGEGDYPEHFQGSTMLFSIITPPLSTTPPAGVAQAPSMTPVPKPQKKRVICTHQVKKLATKMPKVSTPAPVVDLTVEVEHQIPATAIVEEMPNTATTAVHQSQESSPQIVSTSATVSKIFPFGHRDYLQK